MKIKEKKFWQNLLNILNWYEKDKPVVTASMCPLFWNVLIGVAFFIPGSILEVMKMGIEKLPKVNIPNLNIKVNIKVSPRTRNIIFITWLIPSLGMFLWIMFGDFKGLTDLLPVWLRALIFINAILAVIVVSWMVLMCIIMGGVYLTTETSGGQKVTEKIEDIYAVIMDKYCPKINWKDEENS